MNEKRTTTQQATGADDTLPKLLLRNYRLWGNTRVALRKKRRGIWEEYTWENCYQQVKSIFHGMIGLGLEPGDKVVILGDSGLTWFWGELAVQAAGGRVIGISPALSPSEIKPLFQHAQPRFALVRDQEQVDKLLEIEKDIPSVKKIIYWNEKGLRHYTNPLLMSLANMVKAGEDIQKSRAGSFEEKVAQASADATALISYRTDKNVPPEEAVATHRFLISSAESILASSPARPRDEYVSLIYPGWLFEQVLGFSISLLTGQRLNFAEGVETSDPDFREISPHTMAYPSNLWEGLASMIKANIASSSKLKQALFRKSLSLSYESHQSRSSGLVAIPGKFLMVILGFVEFRPLRDKHGLDRIRVAYSAGDPLSEETIQFFRAIGVNLKQIRGSVGSGLVLSDNDGKS